MKDWHVIRILTGIWNRIFPNKKIEKMAAERMIICNACPLIDKTGDTCFAPGTQPCCSVCGCKLSWKVRVPGEACEAPDPKW